VFPVLLCPCKKANESADSLKPLNKNTLKMVAESAGVKWWWRREEEYSHEPRKGRHISVNMNFELEAHFVKWSF
jgi:hypothetical protein